MAGYANGLNPAPKRPTTVRHDQSASEHARMHHQPHQKARASVNAAMAHMDRANGRSRNSGAGVPQGHGSKPDGKRDGTTGLHDGHRKGGGHTKDGDSAAHPGFKGAVSQVEKEGYSKESAGRIIGYNKAHASAAARAANPRLNKTGGKGH